MPPRPANPNIPSESESEGSDSDSEFTGSDVSTPKTAPPKPPPRVGAPPEDAAAAAVRFMDDDTLKDKMRRAQERLHGLDNHVADLRKRSTEVDAMSKGKLPPEQTKAYLEKVKALEAKRRELLERQMDVGEKLQRAATTNGTLNSHRHGGTPRPEREHNRQALVDRLRREDVAARERLSAYKGGRAWTEADAAHTAAVERANSEETELRVQEEHRRERERVAALGKGRRVDENDDDAAQRAGAPPRRPESARHQANQNSVRHTTTDHRPSQRHTVGDRYDDDDRNAGGGASFKNQNQNWNQPQNDQPQNDQNPYGAPDGNGNARLHGNHPFGMHPGSFGMNPGSFGMSPFGMMGGMNGMLPGGMMGGGMYGTQARISHPTHSTD